MKLKNLTWLSLPLMATIFFSSSKLDPNNPPTARTGAPGETTCQASGCHSGGNYSGTVEIFGVPDTILADESYTVTLTNTSNGIRAGFQLTALNGANQKVGTLTAGTGCSIGNGGGRQYVRQSSPRNITNGSASWTFTWKAPATVEGDSIHFYFVSLCANGNGQKTGDNVLVSKKSVVLPAVVSATHNEVDPTAINVYPNPTNSKLSIDFPGTSHVKIMSATGQKLSEHKVSNHKNIDVSKLERGLYFLNFEIDDKLISKTFIKE